LSGELRDGPRRVLVTGAGGFVGANLVRRLAADGHQVVAAVRPASDLWRLAAPGPSASLKGVDIVPLELADERAVERAVHEARPEWAFHLAAHGAYSWQTDPRAIVRTNVLGTVNLVEACRASGCEALVNAGSSSEYGFKDHAPDEEEALEPNSEYAVAKAAATLYCRQVARAGPMRIVTLRLYSVYGPFEDPGRLIATLAARGLRGELPPLADPEVARDFVAVEDSLEAFLAAIRPGPPPGAVYNVGTGRQTSIREMVEVARRELGIEARPDWGAAPRRRWDTTTWVASTERIEAELGWRPQTALDDGFERMVGWLRSSPEVWTVYGADAPDPDSTG
jgi:nucleoside-diphosphate-sugar epimerase